MAVPKPILGKLSKQTSTLPAVIGTCRLCSEAIRHGDDVQWIRRPAMGRAHRACIAAAIEAGTPVTVAAQ